MPECTKKDFLRYVDEHYECIYVPSLHPAVYDGDKCVVAPDCRVWRNIEADMNTTFCPSTQLVPNMEIVHDRAVAELFRGCANGCRFCQAGFIYRPVRERTLDDAYNLCVNLLESTGYDELSLNSLSTSDYSQLMPLLDRLLPYCIETAAGLPWLSSPPRITAPAEPSLLASISPMLVKIGGFACSCPVRKMVLPISLAVSMS